MPYAFDTAANPNVDPAAGDKVVLGDISDTTNKAAGDTKTTTVQQVSNWNEVEDEAGSTYTLQLADRAKTKRLTGTSCAVTIPTNAAVAFPIGTCIILRATGGGTISGYTVAGDTGVTLDSVSAGSCAFSAAYKAVTLTKAAANTWYVDGAVGAVS